MHEKITQTTDANSERKLSEMERFSTLNERQNCQNSNCQLNC